VTLKLLLKQTRLVLCLLELGPVYLADNSPQEIDLPALVIVILTLLDSLEHEMH
jgi:hypothetical protein